MTRKQLERVAQLKRSLEYWQGRLAEQQADIALSSKRMDGMPYANTNAVSSQTEDKAIRLMETAKVIEGKIAEIQIAVAEVDAFIATIDEPLMQQIVGYKCIQLKTYREIAELVDYDASVVCRKYKDFVSTL